MSKIHEKKFEKTPDLCCDSHRKYNNSTFISFIETLSSAFSPQTMGFPLAFLCGFSCVHESQLFAAQRRNKNIGKFLSFF